MDGFDDDDNARIHQNQPYDESLEVPDAEEIASTYSPTPRVPNPSDQDDLGHSRGNSPPQDAMSETSDDPYDDKPKEAPGKEKGGKKGPPRRQALLSARSQKKAPTQEGQEAEQGAPPTNQVVNPQSQEGSGSGSMLPKVSQEGGKSMTAASLPQLAPKAPPGGPAPTPTQPPQPMPQRPPMMPQGQPPRMPQAPSMPRLPSQHPGMQMMPQMRANQMTMQQAAMRARAQMYGGQMQMAQMAQMAYMQRMQMMQMNQMNQMAQMQMMQRAAQQQAAARGDEEDDDDDDDDDDEDDDDSDDDEDSEESEEEEEEEEENPEEGGQVGEVQEGAEAMESVPPVMEVEKEEEEKEVEVMVDKEHQPAEQTTDTPEEDKGKEKKADGKKGKKEGKQKDEKAPEDKPSEEKDVKTTDKPKRKKGKGRKRTTKHEIPPIRMRGILRDHVDLGDSSAVPKPFGTPREALPDIAGVKKAPPQPMSASRGGGGLQSQQFNSEDDDDDDDDEDDTDDDDDDDEHPQVEGAYDPAEFENLAVSAEIKELFQYITRYTPQSIELDHKLKPFIPDFIPSVGDIDAFIKIPRPDNKPDTLGLTVLDEPCAKQSDPTVLDLQLRAISKQTTAKTLVVKSLESAEKNPKAIENWIESIRDLHRSKPPPNVHYSRNMPDIDTLMQEWPPEFEELLKEVSLPTADLDCDLGQFTEIICSILDIPVYRNSNHHNDKIQALHVLFTLYSEFKNSQHFQALAANNQLDNALKDGQGDQLFL